jgi:hypothetical protein
MHEFPVSIYPLIRILFESKCYHQIESDREEEEKKKESPGSSKEMPK